MGSYDFLTIPTSRLNTGWLLERKLGDAYANSNFISYDTKRDEYCHSSGVDTADIEFICNTQEEFDQKIAEYKLMRIL